MEHRQPLLACCGGADGVEGGAHPDGVGQLEHRDGRVAGRGVDCLEAELQRDVERTGRQVNGEHLAGARRTRHLCQTEPERPAADDGRADIAETLH